MRTSAQTLASNPPLPLPHHHHRPPMLLQRFHPTLSTSLFQHFSGARSSGMLISKEEASEMELALIMHMRKCTCSSADPPSPAPALLQPRYSNVGAHTPCSRVAAAPLAATWEQQQQQHGSCAIFDRRKTRGFRLPHRRRNPTPLAPPSPRLHKILTSKLHHPTLFHIPASTHT